MWAAEGMHREKDRCSGYTAGITNSSPSHLSKQMASSPKQGHSSPMLTVQAGVLQYSPSYPPTEMLFLQRKFSWAEANWKNIFAFILVVHLNPELCPPLSRSLLSFSLLCTEPSRASWLHEQQGLVNARFVDFHGRIRFCHFLVSISKKISLRWRFLWA